MLFIALFDNPYGYYQILRWIIFGITCYLAYKYYNENNKNVWIWIFVSIAILFNPILPIHLDREIWSFLNVLVAILLFLNIFKFDKNRMIKIFKSKIFWLILLLLIILTGISLIVVYKIEQKRIEESKCKFTLDDVVENRYFKDTEAYTTKWLSYTTQVPAKHMVYWEIDGILKNHPSKKQMLNSVVLKIYTADDNNILLTESFVDIKRTLQPNESLPFQVRASFNREDEILSKYFDGEEEVRIDLYPYFMFCDY